MKSSGTVSSSAPAGGWGPHIVAARVVLVVMGQEQRLAELDPLLRGSRLELGHIERVDHGVLARGLVEQDVHCDGSAPSQFGGDAL